MSPEMKRAVEDFLGPRRGNPPADAFARFQVYLVARGLDRASEKDVSEAALAVGVPPHEIPDFLEAFGSWL